jgi:hypothetical protein
MVKTVWILGAGFSKPLGGPLLTELFTEQSENYVNHTLTQRSPPARERLSQPFACLVHRMYRRYGPLESRPESDKRHSERWRHAEDFLAKLNLAAQPAGTRDEAAASELVGAIRGFLDPAELEKVRAVFRGFDMKSPDHQRIALEETSLAAKRWFAAECDPFVANAVIGSEAWEPYKQWARALTKHDTILSYNYDLVLEKLRDCGPSSLHVVCPCSQSRGLNPHRTIPFVLKVHGSVDWKKTDEGSVEIMEKQPFFAVTCEQKHMALCTPGPSKVEIYQAWKTYSDAAYLELTEASQVVFLGYRAPESDTLSLTAILTAIKENRHKPRIGVVLGIGGDSCIHAERIIQLLRYVNKDAKVKRLHMFAQDFLARPQNLWAKVIEKSGLKTVLL